MKFWSPSTRSRLLHAGIAWAGYLLSPLSWWNDAVVNLPLAYAFGTVIDLWWPGQFLRAVIFGYWITNIAGLVLLHRGVAGTLCRNPPCRYTRKMLVKDLIVSLGYTGIVVVLVRSGALAPPAELFGKE